MRFSSLITAAVVGFAAIVTASPVLVNPIELRADECDCTGTNNTHDNDWYCGDSRLGPKVLPTQLPLAAEIVGYDRLGGLCGGPFLTKWWDSVKQQYTLPGNEGFQLDSSGKPIKGIQTLTVGLKLDRFGGETGSYLSPYGAPYSQRSIPPKNLNTYPKAPEYPYSYHVYAVTKEFTVESGPIAGYYGQPGQGTQYKLQGTSSVKSLIDGGYLARVNQKDY